MNLFGQAPWVKNHEALKALRGRLKKVLEDLEVTENTVKELKAERDALAKENAKLKAKKSKAKQESPAETSKTTEDTSTEIV